MESVNIEKIWKAYDQKLEKSLQVNQKLVEEVQTQKAKSKLKSLILGKVALLILCLGWAIFLGVVFTTAVRISFVFLAVSAGVGVITTLLFIFYYIYHIVLIIEIDNSESIMETQEKLATLKSSTLQLIRYEFIQAPFYTTWYLDILLRHNPGNLFWFIQIAVIAALVLLTGWWIKNVSIRNADKKWFKWFTDGTGWESVVKAGEFMREIEAFKRDV